MRQFLLAAASVITAAAVCAAALAATGDPAAASNSATNTATNAVPGKLAANDPNRKVCKRVEATGRRALAVPTDVTDPEACTALIAAAVEAFGRVDVLVNNAGIGTAVPALKETPDQFRSVIDLNLNGCYWMAQEFARAATEGGSVINISSVLGLTTAGLPQAAYAASKAALEAHTVNLAAELAGSGVTVRPRRISWPSVTVSSWPASRTGSTLSR